MEDVGTLLRVLLIGMVCVMPFGAEPVLAQSVAVTIDDLPVASAGRLPAERQRWIVESILAHLRTHQVTAVGFVIGAAVERSRGNLVDMFAADGHSIGNHSWSHRDYNVISAPEFEVEIAKADQAIGRWQGSNKLFRFPYLHEGETAEKRAAAALTLGRQGYRNVPVTIDNDDWSYNASYMAALEAGNTTEAAEIGLKYLDHMKERSRYFRELAIAKFGRDMKHILLIHMNWINAAHLGDLLDWYRSEGWMFVSTADAMTDPAYSLPNLYVGPKGLSLLERIAP